MTAPKYLANVPAQVLARGPALLRWCHNRGLMPPTLADLHAERQRRARTKPQGVKPND